MRDAGLRIESANLPLTWGISISEKDQNYIGASYQWQYCKGDVSQLRNKKWLRKRVIDSFTKKPVFSATIKKQTKIKSKIEEFSTVG